MIFEKQITIYNYHKDDKVLSWHKTVISGVDYRYTTEKTVSSSGAIVMTPMLYITIPIEADAEGKTYIDYVHYLKMDPEHLDEYWTVNPKCNEEIVVCGLCEAEITDSYKVSNLKKDYMKSGLICGLEDNTDEDMLRHYRVVCR